MQEQEKLREILDLGEGGEELPPPPGKKTGLGTAALFQGLVCALVLLGLLLARTAGSGWYQAAVQWYRQELAQELQLPSWGGESQDSGEEGEAESLQLV